MTKKLIILLFILLFIIYWSLANSSTEVKKVYIAKSVHSKEENAPSLKSITPIKLDIKDSSVELSNERDLNEVAEIIDLDIEEKLIQASIEDYEYLVENNLLNKDGDEDNLMDSDFLDENENENTLESDDEDDFIDANQFEKAQI